MKLVQVFPKVLAPFFNGQLMDKVDFSFLIS